MLLTLDTMDNDEVLVPGRNDEVIETPRSERRKFFLRRIFSARLLFVLLIIAAIAGTAVVARVRPEWLGINANKGAMSEEEIGDLVSEVGSIIKLPDGETPTIATVTDLDKVKEQPFFKNAQSGDKVLVYTGAKKAYLYRPSEKKIIEVGVVNINNEPQKVAGESDEIPVLTPTSLPPVTVTVSPAPTATFVPTKAPTIIPTQAVISPTIVPTVTGSQ